MHVDRFLRDSAFSSKKQVSLYTFTVDATHNVQARPPVLRLFSEAGPNGLLTPSVQGCFCAPADSTFLIIFFLYLSNLPI
jgi:hypothetical protein